MGEFGEVPRRRIGQVGTQQQQQQARQSVCVEGGEQAGEVDRRCRGHCRVAQRSLPGRVH